MKFTLLNNEGCEYSLYLDFINPGTKLFKYVHVPAKKQFVLVLDNDDAQTYFPMVINETTGSLECILYHYLVSDLFCIDNWLVTVNNSSFQVHDTNTWEMQPAVLMNTFVEIFSANGRLVARTIDNTITVYNLPKLSCIATIKMTPDAKVSIVNDCIVEMTSDNVHVYNTYGTHVATWSHPNIKAVIGNNGIVCTASNNEIRVFLSAGRLATIPTKYVLKYTLFFDAQYIAVLDVYNNLNVYDLYGRQMSCINNVQDFWTGPENLIVKNNVQSIEQLIEAISINTHTLYEYTVQGNLVNTINYTNTFFINEKNGEIVTK